MIIEQGYGYQGRREVWQGRGGGKMGSKLLFKLKKGGLIFSAQQILNY
jgi:hypothetical protein